MDFGFDMEADMMSQIDLDRKTQNIMQSTKARFGPQSFDTSIRFSGIE